MNNMYSSSKEVIRYPISIENLLRKYPGSPIVTVEQKLNQEDFKDQKEKQEAYPIEGAALGIVTFNEGRVALTYRTKPHRGWALPGGRVEMGEAFDKAFLREIREELGIEVHISDLLLIEDKTFVSPQHETLSFLLAFFHAHYESSSLPQRTPESVEEGLEVGLFDLDHLPENMILQDKQKILLYAQRKT